MQKNEYVPEIEMHGHREKENYIIMLIINELYYYTIYYIIIL